MVVSCLKKAARLSMLAAAAVIVTMASSVFAAPARADFERFWEQSDVRPAKTYGKRAHYAKASYRKKKRYAKRKKLGGYAAATEKRRKGQKGVRVAALGGSYYPQPKSEKSLTGSGVRWAASSSCLDSGLRAIVYQVAANYGPLRVNSTCRSHSHNRRVGGARRSKHLSGDAVDFRVSGNVRAVYAFLKSNGGVGGLKHYGGGLFHIDNGPRRSW